MKQAYSTWANRKPRREKKKKGKERKNEAQKAGAADCSRLYRKIEWGGNSSLRLTAWQEWPNFTAFRLHLSWPFQRVQTSPHFSRFFPTSSSFPSLSIHLSLPATNLTQRCGALSSFSPPLPAFETWIFRSEKCHFSLCISSSCFLLFLFLFCFCTEVSNCSLKFLEF